jgi:2-amino-4-hydroxy-6-hydroxymethyldihydropteridine diphosphokinase
VTLAFVGLGANLGEPRSQVERALLELDGIAQSRLVKASSLYRSAPVGHAEQPDFVNAVAQLETGLPAERLLAELQAIEARHARSRSFQNAPRTIDLDLLLHGNSVVNTETLSLPHPRMHQRAFVLMPLLEIAPQISIPGRGPAKDLLPACRGQRVARLTVRG